MGNDKRKVFDDLEKEIREIQQENKLDSQERYELINRCSYEQKEEIDRLTKGIEKLIRKWRSTWKDSPVFQGYTQGLLKDLQELLKEQGEN